MKKTMISTKKGFTLVETVCAIAIIVILLSVIVISVKDHISRAKNAAEIIDNHNKTAVLIVENQVYGGNYAVNSDDGSMANNGTGYTGSGSTGGGSSHSGGAGTGGSGSGSTGGGSTVSSSTDGLPESDTSSAGGAVDADTAGVAGEAGIGGGEENTATNENGGSGADAADAEVTEEATTERAAAVAAQETAIRAYATQHNVEYLSGTEDLPNIIANALVSAEEMYLQGIENGDYTGPRYFAYCPATGEIRLANGNGSYMQCDVGQNLLKAYLRDTPAVNTPGSNVRGRVDSNFLNDSSNVFYIGVNQRADGSCQVVPNLCVDTLGNFNTVITFRYTTATNDTVRVNSNGGWNSYVNYVTNRSGDMLDTSVLDTSGYTSSSTAAHDNPIWLAAINDLRNSYS